MLERFPALGLVLDGASAALRRFPYTLASAVLGTVVAIYMVETDLAEPHEVHGRLLLVAALGVPLFFALSTFAERRSWTPAMKHMFPAGGVLLLLLYYALLPADIGALHSTLMRFALLAIGLHFLVAFLPHLGRDQTAGFWQYNKALFIRFLVAALYSAVLFTGLSIAIAAADNLFGIDVSEEIYFDLWILITGLFQTWVFLAGVPSDWGALDDSHAYPTGLKVFAQYILLPLVGLYFLILIVYEVKIVATWSWPKGWVSQLVLWYSVVGILSLLLLHPLQKRSEDRWIGVFSTWFFRALIPLVVMLFLAILERVSDYGITVNRYLVLGMATGLAMVVLYFVFSRARDIRIIPIVLCVLAFLAAYGPQSAFSVATGSQRARLQAYMIEHQILTNGSVQEAPATIPLEDRKEMSSIISYLGNWQGPDAFSGWFDDSLLTYWEDSLSTHAVSEAAAEQMGFAFVETWRDDRAEEHFYYSTESCDPSSLSIIDYEYLVEVSFGTSDISTWVVPLDGDTCTVRFDSSRSLIEVRVGHDAEPSSLTLDSTIVDMMEAGVDRVVALEQMTFDMEGGQTAARIIFRRLSGELEDGRVSIQSLRAQVLLGSAPRAD